jgi:hypothetical protein
MAVENCAFAGWPNNLKLTNAAIELIVTLDVGPRVISCRPIDGINLFKVMAGQNGKSGEREWCIRGGHRLWAAPEDYGAKHSRTYIIDNGQVEHSVEGEFSARVVHVAPEPINLRREMEIKVDPKAPKVTVEHRLTNLGAEPFETAPWALSVMAEGGFAVIPQPKLGRHPQDYLPNRTMIIWPFTDLADQRLLVGSRLIRLYQTRRSPIKFGLRHLEKWVGYVLRDQLFLKTVPLLEGETYPDMGSNFETFTNEEILELETLGPTKRLGQGETLAHSESWAVFANTDLPDPQDEEAFLASLAPYVKQLL